MNDAPVGREPPLCVAVRHRMGWLAACDTFAVVAVVVCCWFLLLLAWMGTAILAGGIVVVLSGDGCVGSVIEV